MYDIPQKELLYTEGLFACLTDYVSLIIHFSLNALYMIILWRTWM